MKLFYGSLAFVYIIAGWVLGGLLFPDESTPEPVSTVAPEETDRSTVAAAPHYDLPSTAKSILARLQSPMGSLERSMLLERLAKRDPQLAINFVIESNSATSSNKRTEELSLVLSVWAESNLEEAINFLTQNRRTLRIRNHEAGEILKEMCFDAPDEGIQVLQKLNIRVSDAIWEYELVIGSLARTDPALAMERAQEFKAIYEEEQKSKTDQSYLNNNSGFSFTTVPTFERAVLEQWMKHDAETAMEWLRSDAGKVMAMDQAFNLLAKQDPAFAAAELAKRLDSPDTSLGMSGQNYQQLASNWASKDADAALLWLVDHALDNDTIAGPFLNGIVSTLSTAGQFEKAAQAFTASTARKRNDLPFPLTVPHELITGWVGADPNAALEWAKSLTARDRTQAIDQVLGEWARTDKNAAAEHFDLLPDDNAMNLHRVNGDPVANALNPKTAEEASVLLDSHQKAARMASDFAIKLAAIDPADAAEFYSREIERIKKPEAAEHIIVHWTDDDPEAAAEWVSGLPEGKHRTGAIKQLASMWSRFDSESTQRWADTLEGPDQETANTGISADVNGPMVITIGGEGITETIGIGQD